MPARGRELHDVREALPAAPGPLPEGEGAPPALDDDAQSRARSTPRRSWTPPKPSGRGADGEETPGERAARRADVTGEAADAINARQRDPERRGEADAFTHLGQERGTRRGRVRADLRDWGL